MAIGITRSTITLEDITNKVSESEILYYYLNVDKVPCVIKSPLRLDKKPSFGLYSNDENRIFYIDYSTKDKGGLFDLLGDLWNLPYHKVLDRIYSDIPKMHNKTKLYNYTPCRVTKLKNHNSSTDLQCKVRQWMDYDIKYWNSYGISLKWLKYAEVYPISHKIVIKNNNKYIFGADKYAYAYVEHKEGKVTLKIYQPFSKKYKWSNKHNNSVISLWTKVPEYGDKICICSSLKDALCLWANLNIPSIAIQGEGYNISNTAIKELKRRYKQIYICFDNDKAGLFDANKLSKLTGFKNVVLSKFNGGKDISDLYKVLNNKEEFIIIMSKLFD